MSAASRAARRTSPRGSPSAPLRVLRAERRKLQSQLSARTLALVCLLAPAAFAVVLREQSGVPADSLLGVWVHTSGYALPFVVLSFAGYLGFPVLAGALAGDVFSSEDRYGTWKTVLTRSRSRGALFAGKALAAGAFTVALTAIAAAASLVAGLVAVGDQPLVGLSGNLLSSGECVWLVLACWATSLLPALGFASLAILFSVASRSGIVGVLGPILAGLAMQLLALLGTGSWMHSLLLSAAFDDWHGLLAAPRFYAPLLIGSGVSLLWIAACLGASWLLLRRREFAGPAGSRRAGWIAPTRAALAATGLVVLLGAAADLGPAAVTPARLEASITPAFTSLTVLQQRELGRTIPRGEALSLRSSCGRRSGKRDGPGDDWTCTLTVLAPTAGANPFQLAPVIYDVSVKSNGCYKADAPPSFIGRQTMTDVHRHSVVNPLFTVYGCFDTTAAPAHARSATPGSRTPSTPRSSVPPGRVRKREKKALREAERRAGAKVLREIEEGEAQQRRAAEHPAEEEPPPPANR